MSLTTCENHIDSEGNRIIVVYDSNPKQGIYIDCPFCKLKKEKGKIETELEEKTYENRDNIDRIVELELEKSELGERIKELEDKTTELESNERDQQNMSTIKGSFEKYGDTISYEITDEQKDRIVKRLIEFYSTYCHFGEGIHQDDDSLIEAPSVLSDICDDIIKFKSESKEIEEERENESWIHDSDMESKG